MFFERVTPLHIPRGPFQFESFLDDLWDQDDCQCSFGQQRNNMDRNMCTDRWLDDMSAYIPVAHTLAMACQSASEDDDDIAKDDDDSSNFELSRDESHDEESPQPGHNNIPQSDKPGCKIVQLELDLSDFEPEDIKIKTKDGKYLEVKAKHEDKSNSHHSYGEVHRVFTIPENVDPESLKSMLSPEGILRIEAPIRAAVEGQKSPKTLL